MVQAQLDAFRSLLSIAPPKSKPTPPPAVVENRDSIGNPAPHVRLDRIMRVQGTSRLINCHSRSKTRMLTLLILLGNKDMRANESVTGAEIGDGLAQSGRPVIRTDRVMDKLITENYVLKSGFHQATRYRLSNTGHQKALVRLRGS